MAALLSPPCAACGRILSGAAAGAICDGCWGGVRLIAPPFCARCGDELAVPLLPSGPLECPCTWLRAGVGRAAALGPYEGTLRLAVHALKYDGRRSIAPRLARLLVERCAWVLEGVDAVVPVPLHPWRRWRRGFNQTDEIARHLGLPAWRLLRRVRRTAPQASLAAAARESNVRAAFAPRRTGRPWRAAGRTIVLLDDVSTTGATLEACAAVLKALGASEVRALTVARTQRHDYGMGSRNP